MDSLTQIVLGAAVGEAVLGKKVGNKGKQKCQAQQKQKATQKNFLLFG